ncbi:MAG: hypothetical protein ACRDJC_10515 [Thermomicrobiales bacterium]
MSSSWFIIALVALAAASAVLLLYRNNQAGKSLVLHMTESDAHRDYPKEREDARVAHMSAEDRAWEAASLQRNQARIERGDTPVEQST